MNRIEMICRMPRFEIKKLDGNNWKNIPEKDFLSNLIDSYDQITPILASLFKGEEIVISSAVYRIRI